MPAQRDQHSCIGEKNWKAKKENFKARFPCLIDEDFTYADHERTTMLQNIRIKLGLSNDELHIVLLTL